ncbi:MAG: shufflon system plasmid conjugative transfer pilus tip adhesin PilV [Candidatus Symbiodolus clandestinus]
MRAFKAIYGFHLLEMIVALSVLCSLLTLGSRYISKNAENSVNKIVASHLKQVTKSAQRYVQDNFKQLKNHEGPPLDFAKLVEEGYLAENFPKKNHYGQGYQFKVSDTKAGLQLLLTTAGGNPITEASLRQIADLAGSAAGYASVLHQNKIVGTQEGWMLEGFPLKTGHLASLTMVNQQEVMDAATFLRKTKFTDHPEYNEMQTDLSMLANNIHLMEGELTGTLSKDRLQLSHKKGKYIDIYNTEYPYLEIKDSTLSVPNTMTINSANIKIDKGSNKVRLGVDRPEFILEDSRKTWKTEMIPSEIRLESQASGNKSYIGNDYLKYSNKNNFTQVSSGGVSTNKASTSRTIQGNYSAYSGLYPQYIKIPALETYQGGSRWSDRFYYLCKDDDNMGRMFVVLDGKAAKLKICIYGTATDVAELKWWEKD